MVTCWFACLSLVIEYALEGLKEIGQTQWMRRAMDRYSVREYVFFNGNICIHKHFTFFLVEHTMP